MNEEFTAHNANEDNVDDILDECIGRTDVCRCNRCKADIRAYALNLLTPRYVVTKTGSAYARIMNSMPQNQTDIIAAITHGIEAVKQKPNH